MTVKEEVLAAKAKLGKQDALDLIAGASQLYAAKRGKLEHFNLKKETPDDAAIANLVLGPTGNLRAPTLRVGKTLLVGFSEEAYQKVLG